jgi:hypothetical protein
MTDYYPLINKAVAALEKNTGEARWVLYEHARTALVTHLLKPESAARTLIFRRLTRHG